MMIHLCGFAITDHDVKSEVAWNGVVDFSAQTMIVSVV